MGYASHLGYILDFSVRVHGSVQNNHRLARLVGAKLTEARAGPEERCISMENRAQSSSRVGMTYGKMETSGRHNSWQGAGALASASQRSPHMMVTILAVIAMAAVPALLRADATIAQATISDFATSIQLPPASMYLYGMVTGGRSASSPFANGQYAQAVDAAGHLAAAFAYGANGQNSYTTSTEYYNIMGVAVSGSWTRFNAYYASNTSSGAASTSVSFTVGSDSVVVVLGLASSQQSISVGGIPGLQTDAVESGASANLGMVVAHVQLAPGTYTVTEQSAALAAGQDPDHMVDLMGVFVFGSSSSTPPPVTTGWQLVWSDEFNGAAGTPPDPNKWNYDLGGGGWGNGEAETYTNFTNNAFQDGNGNLVIQAIRDSSGNYTSARLQTGSPDASTHTTDLSWTYGLVEARIKLPFGHGVWPAFWMLGEDIGTSPWPACGEIDIMENFGTYGSVNDASVNNGTIHGPTNSSPGAPDYSGGAGIGASTTLLLGETVYDDYHIYAIQWSENSIQFFVDGALYETRTPTSLPSGAPWVFNTPFFILLNLAIGGPNTFLGTPSLSSPFPNQDMLVDYVRVYQPITVSATTPVITPSGTLNAASYLGDIAPGSLATLFGNNLADGTYQGSQLLNANGAYVTSFTSPAGDTVSVNVSANGVGVNAPLIYVSPTQINFQVPWETVPSTAVNVQLMRAGVPSNVETITIASTASPSMFLNNYTTGVAWVTGTASEGCPTTQCAVQGGGVYQLWANGLGPKNLPEQDGVADAATNLNDLSVVGGTASCQLTVGGVAATVTYCGAATGEIIDQLNFQYPAGIPSGTPVEAVLTINGATGRFWLPAPATSAQQATQMLRK
jgi:uncharacterized protein (TIGR03437 family)